MSEPAVAVTAGEGDTGARVRRPIRMAVCGGGTASGDDADAEAVGREIARQGAVLVCGGREGAMEAACRGAVAENGLTIGLLPGASAREANPYIAVALPTGMGQGRNVLVVRAADAVIAIGGAWGTLSEIALAQKLNVPVVLLRPTLAGGLGIETAEQPEQAVLRALELARQRRATENRQDPIQAEREGQE